MKETSVPGKMSRAGMSTPVPFAQSWEIPWGLVVSFWESRARRRRPVALMLWGPRVPPTPVIISRKLEDREISSELSKPNCHGQVSLFGDVLRWGRPTQRQTQCLRHQSGNHVSQDLHQPPCFSLTVSFHQSLVYRWVQVPSFWK